MVMKQNNEALGTLQRGMTEQQVIDRFGWSNSGDIPNPFRTELYPAGADTFRVLLYYTNGTLADGDIQDDELTPIVLKNRRVDGWGWSYWEDMAQQYNIRPRE